MSGSTSGPVGRRPGPRLGRRPPPARPTARTCRSSIAASSSATGSSRRSACAAPAPTELRRAHRPPARAPRPASTSRSRDDLDEVAGGRDRRPARRPTGSTGPAGDASVRITVSRGAFRGRGLLPPDETVAPTIAIQAWPVVAPPAGHLERGLRLVASAVRRDPANPLATLKTTSRADYVFARLEARRAGADDALFLTIDGHLSEGTTANIFLVRPSADGGRGARHAIARLRDPARDDPLVAARLGARASGSGRSRVASRRADLAAADEAFLSSSVAGILPVTSFEGEPIGDGRPGPWTRRARADREAMIAGEDAP